MPLPVIEDVFRVAFNWQFGSQHAVNVAHFIATTADPTAAQLYTDLDANVLGDIWTPVVNGAGIVKVEIIPLDGTSAQADFTTGATEDWSGQTGASEAIINAPVLVSFKTDVRGPRGRGRMFLPFIAESAQAAGFLDATIAANTEIAWESFLTDMQTAGWRMVIASYVHEDANNVISATVELPLATQRRRQDRNRTGT